MKYFLTPFLAIIAIALMSNTTVSNFLLEPENRKEAEYSLIKEGFSRIRFLDSVSFGCKDQPSSSWSTNFTAINSKSEEIFGTYCIGFNGHSIELKD